MGHNSLYFTHIMPSILKLSYKWEWHTKNRDVSRHQDAQPIRLGHNNSAAFPMYRRRWQLAFLTHSEAQNVFKISGTSQFELQDSDHLGRCTL